MDLNCSYKFANEKEAKITVGDIFEAHCQWTPGASVDVNKLAIKPLDPTQKNYDLVLLKSALAGDHLGLALTSYSVGPKDLNTIVITDGTIEWTMQPALKFEVQSVLKPDQKPEMFGPMVLQAPIPFFYVLVLIAAVSISFISAGIIIWIKSKYKKLLKRLESLEDGSQPVQQFFARFRALQREHIIFNSRSQGYAGDTEAPVDDDLLKIVNSVETGLRVFIARRFRIARFEFGWPAIVKEIGKYHDVLFSVLGEDLIELSREFLKAGIGRNKLEPKDVLLISEKTRRWIEKADQLQAAILAKDTQQIRKLRGAK